jgi:uncharacterized protein YegP (UPF0339 family)
MSKRNSKLEIYEDASGEWRWRVVASNKKIVCTSHESFFKKSNAKRAAKKAVSSMGLVDVEDLIETSRGD